MTSGDACPTFRITTWDFYDLWLYRLFMGSVKTPHRVVTTVAHCASGGSMRNTQFQTQRGATITIKLLLILNHSPRMGWVSYFAEAEQHIEKPAPDHHHGNGCEQQGRNLGERLGASIAHQPVDKFRFQEYYPYDKKIYYQRGYRWNITIRVYGYDDRCQDGRPYHQRNP